MRSSSTERAIRSARRWSLSREHAVTRASLAPQTPQQVSTASGVRSIVPVRMLAKVLAGPSIGQLLGRWSRLPGAESRPILRG